DDAEKVADWLHENEVDTPIGTISWNEQGDLNDFKFDIFTWHKDGSKTVN
ncbi:MAG TPA: leucine ABC transporter subunit substrate-binding protein LivK, partial [Burkholderiaceae bacterium]|nr:leucine ABC transporter subunit substrate-binding protein LivK [Burkholderiaceae bacterium]